MKEFFPIIEIRSEDALHDEELGTKPKFWIELDSKRWLFKEARTNTGEDWSEKLAYEFAQMIGIPAAQVELAMTDDGRRGTVSKSFLSENLAESNSIKDDLIHGNEILAGQVLGYDPTKRFGQQDHTIENIQKAVVKMFSSEMQKEVLQRIASYLVLDALIINTDRHHENWGILLRLCVSDGRIEDRQVMVAPTFDHASSLGRELLEQKLQRILSEDGGVERYIKKGKGAIYSSRDGGIWENPLELVKNRYGILPDLYAGTLKKLRSIPLEQLIDLIDKIPVERMNSLSRNFVKAFITYTYGELCSLIV